MKAHLVLTANDVSTLRQQAGLPGYDPEVCIVAPVDLDENGVFVEQPHEADVRVARDAETLALVLGGHPILAWSQSSFHGTLAAAAEMLPSDTQVLVIAPLQHNHGEPMEERLYDAGYEGAACLDLPDAAAVSKLSFPVFWAIEVLSCYLGLRYQHALFASVREGQTGGGGAPKIRYEGIPFVPLISLIGGNERAADGDAVLECWVLRMIEAHNRHWTCDGDRDIALRLLLAAHEVSTILGCPMDRSVLDLARSPASVVMMNSTKLRRLQAAEEAIGGPSDPAPTEGARGVWRSGDLDDWYGVWNGVWDVPERYTPTAAGQLLALQAFQALAEAVGGHASLRDRLETAGRTEPDAEGVRVAHRLASAAALIAIALRGTEIGDEETRRSVVLAVAHTPTRGAFATKARPKRPDPRPAEPAPIGLDRQATEIVRMLAVPEGCNILLVGPVASGKSALLRAVRGMLEGPWVPGTLRGAAVEDGSGVGRPDAVCLVGTAGEVFTFSDRVPIRDEWVARLRARGTRSVVEVRDGESIELLLDPTVQRLFKVVRVQQPEGESLRVAARAAVRERMALYGLEAPEDTVADLAERALARNDGVFLCVRDMVDRIAFVHPERGGEIKGAWVDREAGQVQPHAEARDQGSLARPQRLEAALRAGLVGQDQAIEEMVEAERVITSGVAPEGRVRASFLFSGPTGVGKTETARIYAATLGRELVRIDLTEYQDRHSLWTLIGSGRGYVNASAGGVLTNAILRHPDAVVLFDEADKAAREVLMLLMQMLDAGRITSGMGVEVPCDRLTVILTSNAPGVDAAMAFLPPELARRIGRVIRFGSLDHALLPSIAAIELGKLRAQMARRGVDLAIGDGAAESVAARIDRRNPDARRLRTVVDNEVRPRLARVLLGLGVHADAPPRVPPVRVVIEGSDPFLAVRPAAEPESVAG